MSLRIIKAGIFDTIQDCGRYGYQHLGINPNGAMDRFSAQLANALLGNQLSAPVLELHFPASQIMFEKETIICITGADFSPTINGHEIPLHHPVFVPENSLLAFQKNRNGARCYLSLLYGFTIDLWLNSCSTNLKAEAGGWKGRRLLRYDQIGYKQIMPAVNFLKNNDFIVLPWKAAETVDTRTELEFIIGSEWHWLTKEAQEAFQNNWFQITNDADRMGYRLHGRELGVKEQKQLVSSAVSFGTIQLLPNGQVIILMADHQTTGGYPRVAHIISAHLPILAQKKANDVIQFKLTDLETAESKINAQYKHLQQLQTASWYRMEKYFGLEV